VSIQQNDVIKIAHLARLQIADDEIAGYTVKLSKVITLLEEMNQINTDGILPMAHPFDHAQRLREDKVTESDQRENLFRNAPQAEAGLFLVPQVIE